MGMSIYNFSKDYNRLFDLICQGENIPCFVDYDWDRKGDFIRDLAIVKRHRPYDIHISARGIGYGGVDPWNKEHFEEREIFVKRCEQLKLEWIDPDNTQLQSQIAKLRDALAMIVEYVEVYGDKPFYAIPHVKMRIIKEAYDSTEGER